MADNNITGFIVDSPNALVKTAKGDYCTVTAQSGDVTFGGDTIKIDGGQGFFSLAEIDKTKTVEVKLTDSKFNMQSSALSSGGDITKGSAVFEKFGDNFETDGTGKLTIPYAVVPGSVRINGYTETTGTVAADQFKVTVSANSTDIQFEATVINVTFSPAYQITVTDAITLSVKNDSFPKSGEITMTWPIYADETAEDSDIVGYGQIKIYKAKIKQSQKVGGNYKTASTFDFTLSGLDPRRVDKKIWDFVYIPAA